VSCGRVGDGRVQAHFKRWAERLEGPAAGEDAVVGADDRHVVELEALGAAGS
jgi:hypothetical protein